MRRVKVDYHEYKEVERQLESQGYRHVAVYSKPLKPCGSEGDLVEAEGDVVDVWFKYRDVDTGEIREEHNVFMRPKARLLLWRFDDGCAGSRPRSVVIEYVFDPEKGLVSRVLDP